MPRVAGISLAVVGVGSPPPAALSVAVLGCCFHLQKMPPPFSSLPANLSCRELARLHRRSHTPAEEPGHAVNAFAHGFPSPLAVCSQRCRSPLFLITLSRAEEDFGSSRTVGCPEPSAVSCRDISAWEENWGPWSRDAAQGRKPRTGTAEWGRTLRCPCLAHTRAKPHFHDL